MPIVRTANALILEDSAVPLARYAQLIGQDECAFFGVKTPTQVQYACRTIWTLDQRRMIAKYLSEAQGELEDVLRYPLAPRWIADEEHDWRGPMLTRWGEVIEAGVRAEANIELGAVVDHASDPAEVVVVTSVSAEEIHIFHPGSDAEIVPSSITASGGAVTILIPRCRMVAEAVADNPPEGLEYADLGNFAATVDVKRIYNDPSTNATLVGRAGTSCNCGGCTDTTRAACMHITNKTIGRVDARPANYTDGAWVGSLALAYCQRYSRALLNYRAGLASLPYQMEDAILRLAHSKMPEEPCGCDVAQRYWKRDRFIPEILTRERLNSPFGPSDGAWTAYRFAQSKRMVRGRAL